MSVYEGNLREEEVVVLIDGDPHRGGDVIEIHSRRLLVLLLMVVVHLLDPGQGHVRLLVLHHRGDGLGMIRQ